MRTTLYEVIDDVEVSISSGTQKEFSFRSSLKGIDFDFAILKYKKLEENIEAVVEREKFSGLILSDKVSVCYNVKITNPSEERLETHLILRDNHNSPIRFCFDLGSHWNNGGRFYVRMLGD
jgi:hypothetical protein